MLAPICDETYKVRTCHCGLVQMRAVHEEENLGHLVEVKLFIGENAKTGEIVEGAAQVVKIHNGFLRGKVSLKQNRKEMQEAFTEEELENSLFYKSNSRIVLAPLDTPGVKVVDEWSHEASNECKESSR